MFEANFSSILGSLNSLEHIYGTIENQGLKFEQWVLEIIYLCPLSFMIRGILAENL